MDVRGIVGHQTIYGTGDLHGREVIGGGILLTITMELDGQEQYQEANLFGYSKEEEKIHQFTIGSYGQIHDHIGEWKSGDVLYVEWNGTGNEMHMAEKICYEWKSGDEFEVNETNIIGDKIQSSYTYDIVRSNPKLEDLIVMPT